MPACCWDSVRCSCLTRAEVPSHPGFLPAAQSTSVMKQKSTRTGLVKFMCLKIIVLALILALIYLCIFPGWPFALAPPYAEQKERKKLVLALQSIDKEQHLSADNLVAFKVLLWWSFLFSNCHFSSNFFLFFFLSFCHLCAFSEQVYSPAGQSVVMGIPLGSLPYSGSVAALVKPAVGPQVCLWSHWSPNCHQDCSLQDARVLGNVTEGGILSWLQTDTKLRPSRLQYVKLDINQERSAAGIGVQGSRAAHRGDSRQAASLSKVTNYKVKMGCGEECCIPKPNPDTKGRLHSAHFYL